MSNIQSSLQWFRDRAGRVTYSMTNRNGPNSFDCSSSVYYALKQGAFIPANTFIGNTDTLFNDLEKNGFTQLQPNAQGNYDTQAGDIFIWGRRGASGGAAGHTGDFDNADNIWNCNYGYNGIVNNNYDQLRAWNEYPLQTFYRYTGASYDPPSIQGSPSDQVLEIGSTIRFDGIYKADEVQTIGGVWQVRTTVLCPVNFTWDDNGIPAEPLVEVDEQGYATGDQDLTTGLELYKIPGKFTVLDLGQDSGVWLALIELDGLKCWVDVSTATEISSTDQGTPVPGARPTSPTPPQTPETPTTPPVTQPTETPSTPVTPPVTQPTAPVPPPVNNNPKEDDMAFSDADQKQLKIAQQDAQKVADAVAAQPGVTDLVTKIPEKVKVVVYVVGDSLIGLGVLTPLYVVAVDAHMAVAQVSAISGLFAAAGAFLLTMFGIYKSGKES